MEPRVPDATWTYEELYEYAIAVNLPGRGRMDKDELLRTLLGRR